MLIFLIKAPLRVLGLNFTRRFINLLRHALKELPFNAGVLREELVTAPGTNPALKFYCIGDICVWRAETLFTKEPETIDWLNTMSPGETLWDIGANVGLYSVYASRMRGVRTIAFEPAAQNFYLLTQNIAVNDANDLVTAYCLALSDRREAGVLNMQSMAFGDAHSSFEDTVGFDGLHFEPKYRQGMIGHSIDSFIEEYDPPFPNHIKIDVDGIENKIIAGARETLRDSRLKSLSVELDAGRQEYTDAVVAMIENSGLRFVDKRHAEMFKDGQFANIFNYRFQR
ncbi:MAG: methyltransferase [Rhodospirillaceae bacterium]|nr:methyltransferase [Rhodospirillaceae bacterium]